MLKTKRAWEIVLHAEKQMFIAYSTAKWLHFWILKTFFTHFLRVGLFDSHTQNRVSRADYRSQFWPLQKCSSLFWGSWGSSENWLEPNQTPISKFSLFKSMQRSLFYLKKTLSRIFQAHPDGEGVREELPEQQQLQRWHRVWPWWSFPSKKIFNLIPRKGDKEPIP